MASSSDFPTGDAVMKRPNRGSPIKFLVPLIYAPILPLSTERLFFGVLAGAFAHGAYLVYPFVRLQ
ncbi:hypothetical protein B296_00033416, partial [Ensete ventricosum]